MFTAALVVSGLAVFEVENIGQKTKLRKNWSVHSKHQRKEISPLQLQITRFVKLDGIYWYCCFPDGVGI